MKSYTFSLDTTVDDEAALYAAALEYAMVKDGATKADADAVLLTDDGGIDAGACLQMLLDPGYLPGCSINCSSVDQYFSSEGPRDVEQIEEAL